MYMISNRDMEQVRRFLAAYKNMVRSGAAGTGIRIQEQGRLAGRLLKRLEAKQPLRPAGSRPGLKESGSK